jgi:copper homeostasis protein CutC
VGHLVSQVPTGGYISGMLALMTRIEEDCLIPAGPVEIIAGGGITSNDIEQMRSLTVRDAHLAALFETVPDIVPAGLNAPGWKRQLAGDCSRLLEGKVVVKS